MVPSSRKATDGLAVVEAGPAHAALVSALRAQCFEDGGWSAESVATLLGTPGTCALIAEIAGEPVGFILSRAAADEAEILAIGVPPSLRRGGIAGRLLDAALASLRAGGIGRVFLEVAVGNRAALALYESRGFGDVGRRPGYYARPGEPPEDALVLSLGLN